MANEEEKLANLLLLMRAGSVQNSLFMPQRYDVIAMFDNCLHQTWSTFMLFPVCSVFPQWLGVSNTPFNLVYRHYN